MESFLVELMSLFRICLHETTFFLNYILKLSHQENISHGCPIKTAHWNLVKTCSSLCYKMTFYLKYDFVVFIGGGLMDISGFRFYVFFSMSSWRPMTHKGTSLTYHQNPSFQMYLCFKI